MPDDPNITQDTPTPDSSPTMPSDTPETAPEAPEAPQGDFGAESNNSTINKGDAETSQPENEPKTPENQDSPSTESVIAEADKGTAQISTNEPLNNQTQNRMHELQAKEQLAIKNKKQKKLDLVMNLFLKKSKITNDEVEKFLHVSDATATRYLSELEKEGKIKQVGKTGHAVSYTKI